MWQYHAFLDFLKLRWSFFFFFFLPLIQIEELFAEKAYKANISPAETTEGEETPLNSMKYLQTALGALG